MKSITSLLLVCSVFSTGCLPRLKANALSSSSTSVSGVSGPSKNVMGLMPGTYRVTEGPAFLGAQANSGSNTAGLSSDGTVLFITTSATNWSVSDVNGFIDGLTINLITNQTYNIHTSSAGVQGNNNLMLNAPYSRHHFSPDGTKIIFSSDASNLVASDTNGVRDCFVKDLITGVTTRVSTDSVGAQGTGMTQTCGLFSPANNNLVYFTTTSALVAGDTNATLDIYQKNLLTGVTTRVSVDAGGAQVASVSEISDLSPDGNLMLFTASGPFVAADVNGQRDVYMKNLTTGAIFQVSTATGGVQATGGIQSVDGKFSSTTDEVVFYSNRIDLVAGDTNGQYDAFVKNVNTDVTTRVSTRSNGAESTGGGNSYSFFNGDPNTVILVSNSTDYLATDTNAANDIYLKNRTTNELNLVSVRDVGGGLPGNAASNQPILSPDNKLIFFTSTSTNLVTAADANGAFSDVFVRVLAE